MQKARIIYRANKAKTLFQYQLGLPGGETLTAASPMDFENVEFLNSNFDGDYDLMLAYNDDRADYFYFLGIFTPIGEGILEIID